MALDMQRMRRKQTIVVASVAVALILLTTLFFSRLGLSDVPSFEQVRAAHTVSESVLLDRHGEVIHEVRTDNNARRLSWVPLAQVSPAFTGALVSAEDHRFYQHHGVDWRSIPGALFGFVRSGTRGASTITMQVAAQLDQGLHPSGERRTLWQKLQQMRSALALEQGWSKAQILEAYLNLVTYRGELQGLAAASEGLFGKQAHGLTNVEAVILAALVRSPNAGPDEVAKRARQLGAAMQLGLKPDEISRCAGDAFSHPYFIRPLASLAPHVAQQLLRVNKALANRGPERITCTLDGDIQQFASDALQRHILAVRAQNVHDGAALVVDNLTGEVLAYVGNIGSQSSARYVDGVQALRQAGSTLKPFIYGAAFDRRILTAASLLDDSPLDVPVLGGVYRPSNYDKVFHGQITARVALASSLNVPAVKTLNLVGLDAFLRVMQSAGFEDLESPEFYGPSLALGAADIRLWDLTNAYRCLANGGKWTPLRLTFAGPAGAARAVLSPEAAFVVADILSDRESRSQTFSLESPLSTRFWTAVKTGTSKDMRDNWCIGFSDRYTVGVWAGNFPGEPMWNVSGITGAAPVWVEIMSRLHRDQTSREPAPPPGVLSAPIPGNGRREWFVSGTEGAVLPGLATSGSRIVYPAPGTVIALDPDIPPGDQKVFFEAQPKDSRLHWVLDGNSVGDAGSLFLWAPVRGKHTLSLADSGGRIIDSLVFEVRGGTSTERDVSSMDPGLLVQVHEISGLRSRSIRAWKHILT